MLKSRLKIIFSFVLLLISISQIAQNIPIGTWQDHLPYNDAISITRGNNTIYCATNSALFIYNEDDFSIEKLNLVNGLSDIGISKVKYSDINGKVIIAYTNGNIDIIDESKSIFNLSFIKNSNVVGDKSINHIFIRGNLAYLSTGFGVVVLDTDKLEIKDTYLIGNLGTYVKVNSITIDNINIYAATDEGVYYADKSSTSLPDYSEWNTIPELGTTPYSNIVTVNDTLIVSSESNDWNGDTIYYNPNGVWQKFLNDGYNINNLNIYDSYLFISYYNTVEMYNMDLVRLKNIYTYKSQFYYSPNEAIIDKHGVVTFADQYVGMVQAKDNWTAEYTFPICPSSANVFEIDIVDGDVWFVSGGNNLGIEDNLINYRTQGEWVSLPINILLNDGKARDMISVAINPSNKSQVYFGSWSKGLLEYNNASLSNHYTAQNSLLDSVYFGVTSIGSVVFDSNNNLWSTCSYSNNILVAISPDNSWYSYSFPGITSPNGYYTETIIDNNNYKWIISPDEHKIIVFDDNNTLDNKNDDRATSNSNFPGSEILSITEDQDGEIWLGTDEGVAVYYNPSQVFDQNIEAQQIYIQQDGQTQILLETERVTAIAIDGANRKWIGTKNSGVYLMSEDGTEEIEHFTTENSPLFSNTIYDIEIDHETGEVYFGTEKGLISYKGTATEPLNDFDIFVYPNPVKPGYEGVIAIRGLVKDTDVKITDISGNIVYETTSLGGQAVWDGKDFNGNRVQSGVYMVFNGSPEGDLKAAAKILFLN